MTSAIYRLAAALCPAKTEENPYHDEACCLCYGTGALVPGLWRECPNCGGSKVVRYLDKRLPEEEYRKQVESWHLTGDPAVLTEFPCPAPETADEAEEVCQGRGWTLIPVAEQMGVLVRVKVKGRAGLRVWQADDPNCWVGSTPESPWNGGGGSPEEAGADTLCQALEVPE